MSEPEGKKDIIVFEPGAIIDPEMQKRHNSAAAAACKEIVMRTAQNIQGHRYIKVEGWQAIANTMGYFVGASDAVREYDPSGKHIGWTAKGFVRDRDGRTIATGDGYVGKDEKRWGTAAEYACRAMAQTRAQSRASRGCFAFIAVMIDPSLKTTPAEEIIDEQEARPEYPENRKPREAHPVSVGATPAGLKAKEEKSKAILKRLGWKKADFETFARGVKKFEIFKNLSIDDQAEVHIRLEKQFEEIKAAGGLTAEPKK